MENKLIELGYKSTKISFIGHVVENKSRQSVIIQAACDSIKRNWISVWEIDVAQETLNNADRQYKEMK